MDTAIRFSMAEEWRVSLVIGGGGSTVRDPGIAIFCALAWAMTWRSPRARCLFLFAGSAKAADEAGQALARSDLA